MALQLKHIFPGKGVRPGEPQRNPLIQRGTVNVVERQVVGIARLRQLAQHRLRDVARLKAGDTQDAHTPRPGGVAWATIVSLWLMVTLYVDVKRRSIDRLLWH